MVPVSLPLLACMRKFTIAELRRISAFPYDIVLVGSYSQQRARLGNAVPPVMMMRIAVAVRDGVLARISGGNHAGRNLSTLPCLPPGKMSVS